jgi:hypothetical protein
VAHIVFRQHQKRPAVPNSNGRFWSRTIAAGCLSGMTVAGAAAWRAQIEGQSDWGPINAISHIVWGPQAAAQQRFTAKYTGSGLLLNALASGFWGWLYGVMGRYSAAPNSYSRSAGRGMVVAAVASITDYYLVPRRFTPGFELSLTRRSCPWLYGALAVGLVLPDCLVRLKSRSRS